MKLPGVILLPLVGVPVTTGKLPSPTFYQVALTTRRYPILDLDGHRHPDKKFVQEENISQDKLQAANIDPVPSTLTIRPLYLPGSLVNKSPSP